MGVYQARQRALDTVRALINDFRRRRTIDRRGGAGRVLRQHRLLHGAAPAFWRIRKLRIKNSVVPLKQLQGQNLHHAGRGHQGLPQPALILAGQINFGCIPREIKIKEWIQCWYAYLMGYTLWSGAGSNPSSTFSILLS